ncbi:MAG: hypothetical protein AB3N20_18285 [Rhizobiaceae bacterium]
MIELTTDGISLSFDPAIGQIVRFTVFDDSREISPLHQAPWVGTGEDLPDGIAPHLKTLGGDFFCAPFGKEQDGAPLHGWPANSNWSIDHQSDHFVRAKLDRQVNGASLVKEIELRPGEPFVYQRHTFIGGSGDIEVSNHANVAIPDSGLIRTSEKQFWTTPAEPLETDPALGRSGLTYPARSKNPQKFPASGGTADLTSFPWFPEQEDFVIGLEASGHQLGWTAVTRPAQGDLFLSLRDARSLPMTMLWHSNGGRDYPPWSGRHFGCLGVEEGVCASLISSYGQNPPFVSGSISLANEKSSTVCHVIGAIAWSCEEAVRSVTQLPDQIVVTGDEGTRRKIPFRGLWPVI